MSEHISKVRQRIVGQRRRLSARAPHRVPFKDGSLLAVLYGLLLLGLSVGAMALARPERLTTTVGFVRLTGTLAVSAFSILGMHVLLRMLAPDAMKRNSRVCLLDLVSLLSVVLTGVMVHAMGPNGLLGEEWAFVTPFLYPYTLAPALGALLLGTEVGVAVGVGTSLLMAQFVDSNDAVLVLILGLFASIVMPQLIQCRVRRRMQLLRAAMVASLVLTVGVYLRAMQSSTPFEIPAVLAASVSPVVLQSAVCLASGLGCVLLAMSLLPMLEHLFGVTSSIALNMFADLGHPLLERLSLEAPGTYNHSIIMATLSAAAAERIGANSLLARVGAYYHDIGKLSTPGLFIENSTAERNPHRTLKPTTSASWVRSHIKDGAVLAERYRLPPQVQAILWEHHGTTTMAVFLHKAREQAKAENDRLPPGSPRIVVEESQFRYPGPRPTSRESGIIMLADSVEAAVRSVERPTSRIIANLVTSIVESKVKDEQLDSCPLTLKDLAVIKGSFVTSLSTILHARIPYPTKGDSDDPAQDREPSEALPSGSGPVS